MIKLGPRLFCAASMVRCRTNIVDIGTDHGYLPAYLVEQGIAENVLACDIGVLPLKNAEKTVTAYGLSDRISLRVSDGLHEVSPEEADEIVICGMGGTLISSILGAASWIKRPGMHLILQPMTHTEDVRQYLLENGFFIDEEKFMLDNGKIYCCISAVYDGCVREVNEGFCRFGHLPPRDEIHSQYVEKQLRRVNIKLSALKDREESKEEYDKLRVVRDYYKRAMNIVYVLDVYDCINSFAPFSSAEKWDNSGILVGNMVAEVKKAYVCLDVTDAVVDEAVRNNADLIVSHHPVIFSPKSTVTADSVVYRCIRNNISVISAHTNLDKAEGGVNDAFCEALGVPYKKVYESDGEPTFLNICTPGTLFFPDNLASYIEEKLSCCVSYVSASRLIGKIAVCSGSGADFIDDAVSLGCEALITGEASYHKLLYAKEKGISLFTVGHFESEVPVVKKLTERLNAEFNCTAFVESDSPNSVVTVK